MNLHNSALGNKARKINDADFTAVRITDTWAQELHSQVDFTIDYTASL